MITCSGNFTSGSLRAIRSGADFRRTATLEGVQNAERVFPLRTSLDAEFEHSHPATQNQCLRSSSFLFYRDSILLITTPFSTSIFELNNGGLDEIDPSSIPGFDRTRRTLAACTIARDHACVQITPGGIRVVDVISGVELERWPTQGAPAVEITTAAVNPTQACIALKGGKLIYFSLKTKLDLLR